MNISAHGSTDEGTNMKVYIINALTVIFSLLLSFIVIALCGEGYFRIKYGSINPGIPSEELYIHDRIRGWALRPGDYSYFSLGAFREVDLSINELGLRDRPVSLRPPKSQKRVSVIGDSFVFSAALNKHERFTEKLQSLAGDTYEVVNISVPGYGTGQEFRFIEELVTKGYDLGEIVILVFFTNDIQDNLGLSYGTLEPNPNQPVFSVDGNGTLQQTYPARPEAIAGRTSFIDRFFFYHFLRSRLVNLVMAYPSLYRTADMISVAPPIPRTPGVVAGWYGDGWRERWLNTDRILQHTVNHVRGLRNDIDIFLAFIPSPFQVELVFKDMIVRNVIEDSRYEKFLGDIDRPQRMLRGFCQRNGVPFIDATSVLRISGLNYYPGEGHLNESGSSVVAEVINRSIIAEIGQE